MKTPEGYEKDDIKKYLDGLAPLTWYFNPYMAGFGKSGVPDIIGCSLKRNMFANTGQLFVIEVKRPGKQPTPIQWRRMGEVEAAGGKAFWGVAEKVIVEFKVWIAA